MSSHKRDREAVEMLNADARKVCHRLPNKLDAFAQREQRVLIRINAHPHDHRAKNRGRPLDHVQVAKRDWVE
jgi:hypothetical protein